MLLIKHYVVKIVITISIMLFVVLLKNSYAEYICVADQDDQLKILFTNTVCPENYHSYKRPRLERDNINVVGNKMTNITKINLNDSIKKTRDSSINSYCVVDQCCDDCPNANCVKDCLEENKAN
jgi:hypothetical protein